MIKMQPLTYEQRVHAAHCCKHGCKYGSEDCPVVGGTVIQRFPCHNLGCGENVAPSAEARSALDEAVEFYDGETGGIEENATAKVARAELARLRAIEAAARAFVFADGRSNPPEKYQALKALLEAK